MNRFLIIFLAFYIFLHKSHGQNILPTINTIKTAQLLERKGDVEGAMLEFASGLLGVRLYRKYRSGKRLGIEVDSDLDASTGEASVEPR